MELNVGTVTEVFRDPQASKFEWTIPNCFDFSGGISSPDAKHFNSIWNLSISRDSGFVEVSKKPSRFGSPVRVFCTVGYKKADGSEEDIARCHSFAQSTESKGWRCRPFRHMTSSDILTITCTLWADDSPYEEVVSRITRRGRASCTGGRIDEHPLKGVSRATQTEDAACSNCRINEDNSKDISILLEHLKELFLSGDDHDFLMKVKDRQFRAHKWVLRARSPVFAAMFRSQMTESADDSVTIDDCDPDAFGEFLSYVYTGKVDISSASHALGLYYAGDKYDFPRLKEMSVEFLKNSLTAARISDVINLAVRHDEGELLQKSLVYLATHLQEVLLTVEWQRFNASNPTAANEMCIKALQSCDVCITLNKK